MPCMYCSPKSSQNAETTIEYRNFRHFFLLLFLTPETYLPAIARRAKAGHLKPSVKTLLLFQATV